MSYVVVVKTPDGITKFQDIEESYFDQTCDGAVVLVGTNRGKTLFAPGYWQVIGIDPPSEPQTEQ